MAPVRNRQKSMRAIVRLNAREPAECDYTELHGTVQTVHELHRTRYTDPAGNDRNAVRLCVPWYWARLGARSRRFESGCPDSFGTARGLRPLAFLTSVGSARRACVAPQVRGSFASAFPASDSCGVSNPAAPTWFERSPLAAAPSGVIDEGPRPHHCGGVYESGASGPSGQPTSHQTSRKHVHARNSATL